MYIVNVQQLSCSRVNPHAHGSPIHILKPNLFVITLPHLVHNSKVKRHQYSSQRSTIVTKHVYMFTK